MFDKVKFAQILKNIGDTYDSQRDFSKKSGINRTYLSQYMNMKLDEPPKPKILNRLANASNSIISYGELMKICGYTDSSLDIALLESLREELDSQYLNEIINLKLSAEENEVYNSLLDMYPATSYEGMSREEILTKLHSYFEEMNWINKESKNKIIKCLLLFIESFFHSYEITKRIASIKSKNDDSSASAFQNLHLKTLNNKYYMAPVYGRIAAGQPNWIEECIEGRIPIDPDLMNITNPEECFFLRVNGESMNKEIQNGAYALIRKTDFVENGDIAVVLVNRVRCNIKKIFETRRTNYIRTNEQ